jgi:hypothetical protein
MPRHRRDKRKCKNTRVKPRPRRYHLVDDVDNNFDYENPDWLVGAN